MTYITVVKSDSESRRVDEIIKKSLKIEQDSQNPDYVIAIGGDGTIIKASHKYPNAVIFGVHTGHLGFYANYHVDSIDELIEDINSNNFECHEIDILSCELITKNKNILLGNALNEITILTPLKALTMDVFIDGDYFETFKGTGLCVSTPFGSTAYNRSLNGAIVDTSLSAIQVTEIAGINSNAYRTLSSPLVLNSKRILELRCKNYGDKVYITIDHEAKEVGSYVSIKIHQADYKVKMAYHRYEDQLKRIRRTFLK